MYNASTWSNAIEKGSYLIFSILQQWFESALEKYNNGELPTLITDEDDNKIIDIDIDIKDDEENKETFSQADRNDIEEFLNILE